MAPSEALQVATGRRPVTDSGETREPTAGGSPVRREMDESALEAGRTEETEELPLPVGTLAVVGLYLVVLAVAWLAVYLDFLGR